MAKKKIHSAINISPDAIMEGAPTSKLLDKFKLYGDTKM